MAKRELWAVRDEDEAIYIGDSEATARHLWRRHGGSTIHHFVEVLPVEPTPETDRPKPPDGYLDWVNYAANHCDVDVWIKWCKQQGIACASKERIRLAILEDLGDLQADAAKWKQHQAEAGG